MPTRSRLALILLALFFIPTLARAEASPPATAASAAAPAPVATLVELSGDLPKTGPVTIEELKLLGPVESSWTMHGQVKKIFGVRLDRLLVSRGFTPGKMGKDLSKKEKRAGWKKIALVTAADGFQALLSCAEISQEMGPTAAMLVWQIDGKPLDADQGPIRLVVTTDQEPSRSIYSVRRIQILDVPSLLDARASP